MRIFMAIIVNKTSFCCVWVRGGGSKRQRNSRDRDESNGRGSRKSRPTRQANRMNQSWCDGENRGAQDSGEQLKQSGEIERGEQNRTGSRAQHRKHCEPKQKKHKHKLA